MSSSAASSVTVLDFNRWVDHLNTPEAGIMQFNPEDFKVVKDWVGLLDKDRFKQIQKWNEEIAIIDFLVQRFLKISPLPSQRNQARSSSSEGNIPKKYQSISSRDAKIEAVNKIESLRKSFMTIISRLYSQIDFDIGHGRLAVVKGNLYPVEFRAAYLDFIFLESQLIFEGFIQ